MTNRNDRDVAGPAREPYETPSILYREPLEAVAAVCVPVNPAKAVAAACPMGPIRS
jgi:hypothetical protein